MVPEEAEIDWEEVRTRCREAADGIRDLENTIGADGSVRFAGRNIGRLAARSLESAYRAALESHGTKCPEPDEGGRSLPELVELMRERFGPPAPGEEHAGLSRSGGHSSLGKLRLAGEVPSRPRCGRYSGWQTFPRRDPQAAESRYKKRAALLL